VNQCRRLERLPRLLVSQFGGRQFAEFLIDQQQKLLGRLRIAGFDLR